MNNKPNPPKTAEGPATKEPEQSPPLGSPSGVVEAAMKVFGDFTYEALRHHKERSTKVKEFHAATNLIWDALRALEGAARDAFMEGFSLGHGRGQDWASTGSVKKYAEDGWEYSDAKEKLEKAETHHTKGGEVDHG